MTDEHKEYWDRWSDFVGIRFDKLDETGKHNVLRMCDLFQPGQDWAKQQEIARNIARVVDNLAKAAT